MIVITTPTGLIGRAVLDTVLQAGEAVRVIVRDPSRLPAQVRDRVEIEQGSLDDVDVVMKAVAGADVVFWVGPPDDEHDRSTSSDDTVFTRTAWDAIRRGGVSRVVFVSSLGSATTRSSGLVAGGYAMDSFIDGTGVAYRALRTPALMDQLLDQVESIRRQGIFTGSRAGDVVGPLCAIRDVAAAAAAVLLDHSWTGQGSVSVLGPEELSFNAMASLMSEVLKRPVHYRQISDQADADTPLEQGGGQVLAHEVVDGHAQTHQDVDNGERRSGAATSPTTFRQWCADELAPAVSASRAREIRDGFTHLHAVDPVLAALIDKRPEYDADAWRRELPEMDLFGCLVFQVIGQQISVTAAGSILRRLTQRFDGRVPSPAEVSTLEEQTLRDLGLSWRKARTLRDLAARFTDGRLSEAALSDLPDEEVIDKLTEIPGVGRWTVQGALLIALRRSDVVATGDILLRNTIRTCYGLDHVPTEQEVADIATCWQPYGSLGVNLIFAAAELG